MLVARYNSNRLLDTSFSSDGILFTDFTGVTDVANGVAIQVDGKIVTAGTGFATPNVLCVSRYNDNGSLDTTFSGDGRLTFSLATEIRGNDLLIQGDGKIVIIGASDNTAFAVVRLNPDGSPDLTFDTDGVVTTAVGTGEAQAGRIMPDGKNRDCGTFRK